MIFFVFSDKELFQGTLCGRLADDAVFAEPPGKAAASAKGKIRAAAAGFHGVADLLPNSPYFLRIPAGPHIAKAVLGPPHEGGTGVNVSADIDESRFPAHGVTLGKVILSRLRQAMYPVLLCKMDLAACQFSRSFMRA